MKNSNDNIGNRTRELPNVVQCHNQLRYQQRAPLSYVLLTEIINALCKRVIIINDNHVEAIVGDL
jgi:hypothetical protein